MKTLLCFFVSAVLFSFSVFAEESELYVSFGGVSFHHQKIEGVNFNEVHPGIGLEFVDTPVNSIPQMKYSVFGHYMVKDSFDTRAYWIGVAAFYRFEPIQSWQLDLGLGAIYLDKSIARWSSHDGSVEARQVTLTGNQQVLPMPYLGVNKRLEEGGWVKSIGVNLIHAPRISGHNEVSVTYLQAKISF